MQFPVRDQYGNEEVLRARLYHPFVDAVRRLLDPDSPALLNPPPPVPAPPPATTQTNGSTGGSNQQTQQSHGLDVDLYRGSDVSLISLQNSPAACGLQGGEPLLLYRYGRCSREYWQSMGQPERGLKPTYAGLYISDYKNQVRTAQPARVAQVSDEQLVAFTRESRRAPLQRARSARQTLATGCAPKQPVRPSA